MIQIMQVRGVNIGEGIPKICVPVVGKSKADILQEVSYVNQLPCDLVEWRADYYDEVEDIIQVQNLLLEMRKMLSDKPLIFTFRSLSEGGERKISKEYYTLLIKEVINTKCCDLIDVELYMGEELVKEILPFAHENRCKVIVSNHDFLCTPPKEALIERLLKMQELGADIPKIAVMPKKEADVITLLEATREMADVYANRPIVTMSMAGIGVISRLAGEVTGSAITFAAGIKASAPGQLQATKMKELLQVIHGNLSC